MLEQTVAGAKAALATFVNPEKQAFFPKFFKAGPGQYGEGDIFLGVTVPNVREVAKQFAGITEAEIYELMQSPIHEHRLLALIIMVGKWKKAISAKSSAPSAQQELFDLYLRLVYEGRVNNWDLVDTSAPYFGMFLIGKPDSMKLLESLAHSEKLWERRVSIMFTFAMIRSSKLGKGPDDFAPTLHIAEILLHDKHDLIHKAVGWMLREVGNRDVAELRTFLSRYAAVMPRTMLRYAIEKLDADERKVWLGQKTISRS
ncbi:MAG: DNA alkylation repair protein [Rhodoluna sp.]|nr:DNA alkylation repair protein [Rhodoluna sp.]